jgi:phage replication O-like protein O
MRPIQYSFIPNHTATMEALARSRLSGREFRIVLLIMRQTNGYLREEDQITPAFFQKKTGIGKDHLPHVISKLQNLGIITTTPGNPPFYSVQPPQHWKAEAFTIAKYGEKSSPNMARKFAKYGEKQIGPIDNIKKTNIFIYNNNNKHTQGRFGHMVAQTISDLERIKGKELNTCFQK